MKKTWRKNAPKALALAAVLTMLFSFGPSSVFTASAVTYGKTTYEAESATKYNVNTNTNHTGYSGTGFVDSYGDVNDYVQFSITVSTAQDYILRFKYSNYTGTTNVRAIYVDGTYISNAYFKDVGSWDTWGTSDVGTNLTAGTHTVKALVSNSSDGFINLDNLVVTSRQETVRALYQSNWSNQIAIWKASHLANNDTTSTGGPRIDELHYSGNWELDQINDYSGFFRDETNSVKYDQIHNFDSEAYYDESGVLHTNYLEYNGSYLPNMEISRDYVMVPNEDYMVVRYSLKNTGSSSLTYKVLDMFHPKNSGSNTLSASYDSTRKAIIFNMSNASQPYMALGAFAAPTAYQVANDADSSTSSATCAAWYTFDATGTLKNNGSVSAADTSGAFMQSVTVAAGATQNVYFYVVLNSTLSGLQSACDEVRAQTGAYWYTSVASTYSTWFSGVTVPSFTDAGMLATYKRNLVMIKNCTRPGTTTADGAFPATTNSYNYGYKVWARDSAVTAMALDACGLTTEAGRYWNWLAARQASNGTFETCYNFWNNTDANFVEPEYDSMGFFLIGVYKHYLATGDSTFLNNIYDEVQLCANYIMNNINTAGFGPADFSIFEESDKYGYYTYTQAGYAMGLKAAALMASIKGNETLADSYNGAGSTILTAMNRDTTSGGLWDNTNKYYVRLVYTDGTIGTQVDSSTNMMFALGAMDAKSSRSANHISKVEAMCGSDTYGLCRYPDDDFYGDSPWSPGGNEALEDSPSWPQMTMWDCVYQKLAGNTSKAYAMLQWFVSRTATGYMVTGECISDVTEQPCVSTASEPITAASYIIACLQYYNLKDARVFASESNAACYKSLTVTSGASADWSQYTYVPYYTDPVGDTAVSDSDTDIAKVYISNDANNVYVRINNVSGTLTSSNSTNDFQMSVYTEAFGSGATTKSTTANGTNLKRNMAYWFTRKNVDSGFSKYTVSSSAWTYNKAITSVIAPQWDPSTGGMEIVIPRSEIGSPANGAWGHITVMLQQYSGGSYVDQDSYRFNYCLKGSSDSWLYGNFE